MPDVELQLPEEAESLGISNIACREGTFLIVYLGKEYICAFPSAVWGINRDQQATLAYLYDRLTNGDVQLPFKIVITSFQRLSN